MFVKNTTSRPAQTNTSHGLKKIESRHFPGNRSLGGRNRPEPVIITSIPDFRNSAFSTSGY